MKRDMVVKELAASILSVILMISFVGLNPSEILAQGTNATNATSTATNATGLANATSTAGVSENTVVMALGSSASTSGEGYEPDPITVSPGATVVWDNQDNALHTATSGDPNNATPDGLFDTGFVGPNQKSQPITMPTEPGEYTYFCTLHPFLVGSVIVLK